MEEAVLLAKRHYNNSTSYMRYLLPSSLEQQFHVELREDIVPRFWKRFAISQSLARCSYLEKFCSTVKTLYDDVTYRLDNHSELDRDRLLSVLADALFVVYPQFSMVKICKIVFSGQYWFHYRKAVDSDNEDNDSCACGLHSNAQLALSCEDATRYLRKLKLLDCFVRPALELIVEGIISEKLAKELVFEESHFGELLEWSSQSLQPWLAGVSSQLPAIEYKLCHSYAVHLIDHMFDIIREFPDSEPALEDLKQCLDRADKVELRKRLVTTLKSSYETRLLHPGAGTTDILTQYVASIKSIQTVDPSGVILDIVCDPVRKYLRCREDTVRCIVSSLTDGGQGLELGRELLKGTQTPLVVDLEVCEETPCENWQDWCLPPIEADPKVFQVGRHRKQDILTLLVSVYGSKDLFINEYRSLLADRLLATVTFECDKEIRYLELLKMRFGDSNLSVCEYIGIVFGPGKAGDVGSNPIKQAAFFAGDDFSTINIKYYPGIQPSYLLNYRNSSAPNSHT